MTVRGSPFRSRGTLLVGLTLAATACTGDGGGAKTYAVESVLDGDTFDLTNGTRIRMLGIDAPERSTGPECYGQEAFNYLSGLIGDNKVKLEYDVEREDNFGRTLAWVYADGVFLNAKMIEDGYACVLIIPPNGAEYETFLESLESGAVAANRGLWGACGGCDTPKFAGRASP